MQIYVKLFSICHHAPIKIVHMTFREKKASSDKSLAVRFGGRVTLGSPGCHSRQGTEQGPCEGPDESLIDSSKQPREWPADAFLHVNAFQEKHSSALT